MLDAYLNSPVWIGIGGVYAILAIAALVILGLKLKSPDKDHTELVLRTRTWFWIVASITIVAALGQGWAIVFIGFISFLAFKEYLSMIPTRRADRSVLFWAYLCIPFQYWLVYDAWYGLFTIFIPVYAFVLLAFRLILSGETKGFIKSAGTLQWGLMLTVYNLSHLAFLLVLPIQTPAAAGGAGLLFYVVFLTQFNDVAQFFWGKLLGKHKIIPKVSPGKTWEGFIGGMVTTAALSALICGYFTPFSLEAGIAAGAIIATLGFIGDVTVSSVKRDLDMKDSGNFLPGHGGILDRLDSLTLVAPVFLHFTRYFYG